MSRFVDFHCHGRCAATEDILCVPSYRAGYDALPSVRPEVFSLGIHPWDAASVDTVSRLRDMAEVSPPAIGEIGLDKACGVDMDIQVDVFRQQLELAATLHRPVVIHAVRTLDIVTAILAEYPGLGNVAFHGYIGDRNRAEKLADAGYYLSFGYGAFRSPKTLAALSAVPAGSLLLETDDRDMPVSDLYIGAARERGDDLGVLKDVVFANYRRFFNI